MTKLHLVGISIESSTMHGSMNIKINNLYQDLRFSEMLRNVDWYLPTFRNQLPVSYSRVNQLLDPCKWE